MSDLLNRKLLALLCVLIAALLDIGANLLLKKSQGFTHKGYNVYFNGMGCF